MMEVIANHSTTVGEDIKRDVGYITWMWLIVLPTRTQEVEPLLLDSIAHAEAVYINIIACATAYVEVEASYMHFVK